MGTTLINKCLLAYSIGVITFVLSGAAVGQGAKVNESCDASTPCESGLNCIALRDSTMKCSTCTETQQAGLSDIVDESCKAIGEGWSPGSNRTYQEATASDGRVADTVFGELFEQAKTCKAARETREKTCWDGGDAKHREQIEKVNQSIKNIEDHRDQMLRNQRVFYTDKNRYENYFGVYSNKCTELDLNNMTQKIDEARASIDTGTTFDCVSLKEVADKTMECLQASKQFKAEAFRDATDRYPEAFAEKSSKATAVYEKAIEVRKGAEDKSLCK
jgi:hypothetical protein